LCVARTWENA